LIEIVFRDVFGLCEEDCEDAAMPDLGIGGEFAEVCLKTSDKFVAVALVG
tara:strand:- start:50962 stop:51111 length:150 start_codon:yes stop_codon:yes gene_type:complete